jgi:hypothetical protein
VESRGADVTRPPWDFDYLVVSRSYTQGGAEDDIIVALSAARSESEIARALSGEGASVETVLVRSPIFWYRIRLGSPRSLASVASALDRAGLGVRYTTSATRGTLALGEPLDPGSVPFPAAMDWPVRAARSHDQPRTQGRWHFHERGGADIDRATCGTGAGTRLAVIDDEAMAAEALPLDQEIFVGTSTPSRSALHGSLMVAWSVGLRGGAGYLPFSGVAPDASVRLYLIPKPGRDVVSLPHAIVRAVSDGADVIVCATYIDGTTSPLLDDALAVANGLGRQGRGTAVVLPTSREVSSPPGSLHASLTLSLGDPASDPRVLCVAPSGREGGWFLWTDKRGKLRPFANRGPAVRVAAPGDDMSYPFATSERLGHAESSGASAVAAGVALLVLARQPDLRVDELYDVLATTASREDVPPHGPLADAADFRPLQRDGDGHDAKCGYGRVSARRACLYVADPVAQMLLEMGDEDAARTYLAPPVSGEAIGVPYSPDLARWAARVVRTDAFFSHSLRVLLRHFRLASQDPARQRLQPASAAARQLALVCDRLLSHDPPPETRDELARLRRLALAASRGGPTAEALQTWCSSTASRLWNPEGNGPLRGASAVGSVGRSA